MFKNLPRHQFGNLQSKMFSAYFSMVGVCCAITVGAFGYLHPWKTSAATEKYQLGFLLAAFAFNLSIFTPMTIKVIPALDSHTPIFASSFTMESAERWRGLGEAADLHNFELHAFRAAFRMVLFQHYP